MFVKSFHLQLQLTKHWLCFYVTAVFCRNSKAIESSTATPWT